MKEYLVNLGYVVIGVLWLIVVLFFMQQYQQTQLIRTAKTGDIVAMYELGRGYATGDYGLKKDPDQATRWLGDAAQKKYIPAIMTMAKLYATGDGVGRNPDLSYKLYLMAAEHGNTEAAAIVGRAMLNGDGMEMDHTKGIRFIEMAASDGNAESQALMGQLYFEGHSVDCNPNTAREWLGRAVAQNNEEAKLWMAALDRGEGCQKKETQTPSLSQTPIPPENQDDSAFPPPVEGMSPLEENKNTP